MLLQAGQVQLYGHVSAGVRSSNKAKRHRASFATAEGFVLANSPVTWTVNARCIGCRLRPGEGVIWS
jgi:hypothetical protein